MEANAASGDTSADECDRNSNPFHDFRERTKRIARYLWLLLLIPAAVIACGDDTAAPVEPAVPPFHGTAFISPDIITASDPSAFQGLTPAGQGSRTMFDRRVNGWITVDAHLFHVTFDDGLDTEVQVNPEFDPEAAQAAAEKYALEIGRLPTALRTDVETVWIHEGNQLFGGGNRNILIHVAQADAYEAAGILQEVLLHEAVRTSLDAAHATSPGWRAAQAADGNFISIYAQSYPVREDLAESFGPWMAVRYRSHRMPQSLINTIKATIPNRIEYLDAQGFDMYPIE